MHISKCDIIGPSRHALAFSLIDEWHLRNCSEANVACRLQIFLHSLPWQCVLISFRIIQDKQHDVGEFGLIMLSGVCWPRLCVVIERVCRSGILGVAGEAGEALLQICSLKKSICQVANDYWIHSNSAGVDCFFPSVGGIMVWDFNPQLFYKRN